MGKQNIWAKQSTTLSVLGLVLLSGCAHMRTAPAVGPASTPNSMSQVLSQDLGQPSSASPEAMHPAGSSAPIEIAGVKLQHTQFDIPIRVNSQVEEWIAYFTGRGRENFEKYLDRSELFVPYIQPLLKQNGLPQDLVYLAMIESGFNNHARSRAKAVGPWQFISATGKRYGVMVNWWVDERRDTRKSTLAAVEYLRDLYNMFQSWELAAAAYNAGEAKVARAIRLYGTTDFWELSRHRFLKRETRDYVPKIIAAAIISKNRTQFGFKEPAVQPSKDEAIAGDGEIVKLVQQSAAAAQSSASQGESISEVLKQDDGSDLSDDFEDSPEADVTPVAYNLPGDSAAAATGTGDQGQQAKPIPTPTVSKKGVLAGEELVEFEVQSPADLLQVARAAGLSYQTVKSLNPELLRWCTPPTVSSYRLRLPASVKDRFLATYNHPSFPRKVHFMTYKVRRGETLLRIAHRFGIRVDPISDLNGISPRLRLRRGLRVMLPLPNDRSRSIASLEVRDPPSHGRYRHRRGHVYRHRRGHHRASSDSGERSAYRVSYRRRAQARAHGHGPGDDHT